MLPKFREVKKKVWTRRIREGWTKDCSVLTSRMERVLVATQRKRERVATCLRACLGGSGYRLWERELEEKLRSDCRGPGRQAREWWRRQWGAPGEGNAERDLLWWGESRQKRASANPVRGLAVGGPFHRNCSRLCLWNRDSGDLARGRKKALLKTRMSIE